MTVDVNPVEDAHIAQRLLNTEFPDLHMANRMQKKIVDPDLIKLIKGKERSDIGELRRVMDKKVPDDGTPKRRVTLR